MIKHIDAEQLKAWMDKNEAIVIDVREPAEYKAEHIPGSILLSLADVALNKLPEHTGKKLVFQCYSGKRGSMACKKLASANAELELYNVIGGIMAWTQAGYDVVTSQKFFLPLDRQVQLTIGLGVLVSTLLAYAVHPVFLFLTGFFGLGLTFAGLTGFCGLARLLSTMPWNKARNSPPQACGI